MSRFDKLKQYRILPLFLSFLKGDEIMRLLLSSKRLQELFCLHFVTTLPRVWHFYHRYYQYQLKTTARSMLQLDAYQYHLSRDFLLLHYLQPLVRDITNPNFKYITDLLTTLKLTHILQDPEYKTPETKNTGVVWNTVLAGVSQQNQNSINDAIDMIKFKLEKQEEKNIEQAVKQLNYLVAEKSHIVVTFHADIFSKKNKNLLNFFQTRKRSGKKTPLEISTYISERIAAEFLHYAHAKLSTLHEFLINPHTHPCYGTLQFRIEPINAYGSSFMVMNASLKKVSTAIFGAPFTQMYYKNLRYLPVRIADSVFPLIAQFPQDLLQACLTYPFPHDFNMQFEGENGENTKYIEVQLPANIPMKNSSYVEHFHFGVDKKLPDFSQINSLLKKGISISIGINPFCLIEFSEAFQKKEHIQWMHNRTINNIHKAILFIGETNPSYLTFTYTIEALTLSFNITDNSPMLHQAQVAAILYLLGVEDLFKTISALSLTDKIAALPFVYRLPLNNTLCKQGGLTDHDAYSNNFLSLRKLLAKLLKRIFSVILVSKQNETYWLQHNKPHPVTGKGATEETNQTRGLYLGDEKQQYDFDVHCWYEGITLEMKALQTNYYDCVFNVLASVLGKQVVKQDNIIIILLTVPDLLSELEKHKSSYQACIIYENNLLKYDGDLLLAWRDGYVSPGGHNNDPYS